MDTGLIESNIRGLLYAIEGHTCPVPEDITEEWPLRAGIRDTPARVAKAYAEWFCGYVMSPEEILNKNFQDDTALNNYDEMIIVKDIPFSSMCEHHMAPFIGKVHIGYLPHNHIVGLSKLPRLVECYSRRLQVQERMTNEIAEAIQTYLSPIGVGVVVEAEHTCMSTRGIKSHGTTTITSRTLGVFRTKDSARAEFLSLVNKGK